MSSAERRRSPVSAHDDTRASRVARPVGCFVFHRSRRSCSSSLSIDYRRRQFAMPALRPWSSDASRRASRLARPARLLLAQSVFSVRSTSSQRRMSADAICWSRPGARLLALGLPPAARGALSPPFGSSATPSTRTFCLNSGLAWQNHEKGGAAIGLGTLSPSNGPALHRRGPLTRQNTRRDSRLKRGSERGRVRCKR